MDKNTLLNLIKSNIENDNISIDDVKKELDNYYICPLDKKNSLIIENRIKKI